MQEKAGHRLNPAGRRGRGAATNRSGRYERFTTHAFDDGWGTVDEAPPPHRTRVTADTSRTILARNTSPDIPFDRSINPYRGCEHGCFYCYARPSHAWLGLSPGLDFESRIIAKHDAPELLQREFAKKNYRPAPIALGSNTDPYQPVERELQITRRILKVMQDCRHPVTIVTKSQMVLRDVDILADMAADGLAKVAISVTTLDRHLARRMEPRAATPSRRLDVIEALSSAGIPTAVMVAPVIPALTDHEMETILEAGALAGAREAGYVMIRLPLEIKELAREWLMENAPDRARRVLSLIHEVRNGKDNDSTFHRRQRGMGPYADLIAKRFRLACRRHHLNEVRTRLETRRFRAPRMDRDQLSLF